MVGVEETNQMSGVITSVTEALRLAQEMAATQQPNPGIYFGVEGPYGPIGVLNADLVKSWIDNMPESVNYVDQPAWDADNTKNNTTGLPFPPAVGCDLAWISLYCARYGGSLDVLAKLVVDDPYLVLTTAPNSPSWDDLIAAEKDAGWPASNDPFLAWLPMPTSA